MTVINIAFCLSWRTEWALTVRHKREYVPALPYSQTGMALESPTGMALESPIDNLLPNYRDGRQTKILLELSCPVAGYLESP